MKFTLAAVAATALSLSVVATAAPAAHAAPSSTIGLYGSQDPTYDGVYRQSLAILGLTVNGIAPDKAAVDWLINQQCADGSFQAYRADLTKPCDAVDATKGTGPDTNSTAMALLALMALDATPKVQDSPAAKNVVDPASRAGVWLMKQQRSDGGFPYFPGSASDANSTGLALNAVMTQAPNFQVPVYRKAKAFLAGLASPCAAGGGLPYQAGGKVDALSTSQAAAGLLVAFGQESTQKPSGTPKCGANVTMNALSYLATAVSSTGMLASSLGDGPDADATATAVLDLAAAHTAKPAITKATAALKADAPRFTAGSAPTSALGMLLQVARVTGSSPRAFGGVNLVTTLTSSMRRA